MEKGSGCTGETTCDGSTPMEVNTPSHHPFSSSSDGCKVGPEAACSTQTNNSGGFPLLTLMIG